MSDSKLQANEQLKAMTKLARERAEHPWRRNDAAKLAHAHRYIRVGGNGFRAISIDPRQPCGELHGFPGSVKSFSDALDRLKNLPVSDDPGSPGNNKGEHRLQAYLIRMALTQSDGMPKLLACDDLFDELVFVTDELNFDNVVRADMVFLGRKGDTYFPALVELKMQRDLDRLTKQLANAEAIVNAHPEAMSGFISAAVAPDLILDAQQIDVSATRSIIIWPRLDDPSRASRKVKAWTEGGGHRHVVEFHQLDGTHLESRNVNYTFSR